MLGGPLPTQLITSGVAVATVTLPSGFVPAAAGAAIPMVKAADIPGVVVSITQFPVVGGLTPISGSVTGLATPAAFEAVLYVRDAGGVAWWIKPVPGSSVGLSAAGAFSFVGWASNPASESSAWASFERLSDCVTQPLFALSGRHFPTLALRQRLPHYRAADARLTAFAIAIIPVGTPIVNSA